jgi:hypothetical protein
LLRDPLPPKLTPLRLFVSHESTMPAGTLWGQWCSCDAYSITT